MANQNPRLAELRSSATFGDILEWAYDGLGWEGIRARLRRIVASKPDSWPLMKQARRERGTGGHDEEPEACRRHELFE